MRRRAFLAGAAATAAGGLTLAGCAGYSRREMRALWPPIGRFIEVDGLPVHYVDQGRGQAVILVHGASGNLRDWTFDVAPMLAGHYRVIAFDRPGFGYSARLPERGWEPAVQAAQLHRAARQLGVERPIVVGHSWGGALAMAWGLLHPDELRGLVNVAGATMPWGGDVSFLYDLATSPVGPVVAGAVSVLARDALVEAMIEEVFAPQPVPEGYADYIGWPLSTRPRAFRWNARDVAGLDGALAGQARRYPSLRVPVEILHGTADTTVSPELHAVGMHELLPSSRLTLLRGLGHMPHHFAAESLGSAIARLATG